MGLLQCYYVIVIMLICAYHCCRYYCIWLVSSVSAVYCKRPLLSFPEFSSFLHSNLKINLNLLIKDLDKV